MTTQSNVKQRKKIIRNKVVLTAEQREELDRYRADPNLPPRARRHADIIHYAAQNLSWDEIKKKVGVAIDTINNTKHRFSARGVRHALFCRSRE